jgi:eukaryotic-like serine/threonine-protein kinase
MEAGTRIGAQVELRRPLSEGGMGTLWVGFHQGLQTEVAVKFLAADFARNEEAIARLSREATIAAKVRSPHIVQQLDHGIAHNGAPYIVMELLNGEDLASMLEKQKGPLSTALTLEIVRQTCRALAVAHDAAVVHRDIKPANIFVIDNDGEPFVKLLDFGIARDQDFRGGSLTQTGALMGTPLYMSPEQLFQETTIDKRTDLWALAVVVYQCLTGKVPFIGESLPSISVAVAARRYLAPTAARAELPEALNGWCARGFASAPDLRFQSARELSDTLWNAFAHTPPESLGRFPAAATFFGGHTSSPALSLISATAATALVDLPPGLIDAAPALAPQRLPLIATNSGLLRSTRSKLQAAGIGLIIAIALVTAFLLSLRRESSAVAPSGNATPASALPVHGAEPPQAPRSGATATDSVPSKSGAAGAAGAKRAPKAAATAPLPEPSKSPAASPVPSPAPARPARAKRDDGAF